MPVRFYSKNNKLPMRALQVFTILIGCAHRRETLTYNILAKMMGYKGAGVLDRQLGLVMHWCADNQLPPLTVLVVKVDTGLPGTGLTSTQNLHADRELVFKYDWYGILPPTVEELEAYGSLR